MLIKIDIPDILLEKFKVGTQEDREEIAGYICNEVYKIYETLYETLYEEVDNGKD